MIMTREITMENSTTQRLRCLQSSVEQLPNPWILWTWADGVDAIGPADLDRLLKLNAIERVGDSQWWRVVPRFATYVERVYHSGPDRKEGQETLSVGRLAPAIDRSESWLNSGRSRIPGQQVTFDGSTIKLDTADMDFNAHSDGDSLDPAEYPGQMKLDEIDKWLPKSGGEITVTFGG